MAETKKTEEQKEKSIFETLYPVNVSDNTEKKGKLTYLSWTWAWAEVKKRFPKVNYRVIKNDQGWIYHTDGRTCWVEVEVTIDDLTHTEILPVMDYNNRSIPLARVTSFDVNTSIQRAVTKCISRFGLGLYIYAGEDLPEDVIDEDSSQTEEIIDEDASQKAQKASKTARKTQEVKQPIQELPSDYCTICRLPVTDWDGKMKSGDPVHYSKEDIISRSTTVYGSPVCMSCMMKRQVKAKQNKEVSNE